MRIAIAASEGAPYSKTGGLGDVIGALPAALAAAGQEVSVFLPYARCIREQDTLRLEYLTEFYIRLGWRQQYVGLLRLDDPAKKYSVYFIDNRYYFDRDMLYGYPDDGERYAFYAKAVLSCLNHLQFHPQILHCNDWQTALIPLLVRSEFAPCFSGLKTVFTIHNVEYQGWTAPEFFSDVLAGLPDWCRERLQMGDGLNFMKAGIETADAVTTVSETYARELQYPYFAHGMDGVVRACSDKLCGIVNGIDTSVFSPLQDVNLFFNYHNHSAAVGKTANKQALQRQLGLPQTDAVPMLAMVTRLAAHKGIDLLLAILDRLLERSVQVVIVGTGDADYAAALHAAQQRRPDRLAVRLCFDPVLASRIYAAADVYLMPSRSEPCGLSQLIAMHYGAVPVVHAIGGLRDTVLPYDLQSKTGCGFTFQSYNAEDFLGAIDRCLSLCNEDQAAWNRLVQNNMELDVSWNVPAQAYLRLFQTL